MRWAGLLIFLSCLALAFSQDPVRIKSRDVVGVAVAGLPEYSGRFTVLGDGRLSGPGFGIVMAGGRSLDQIKASIVKNLQAYVKHPAVDVYLAEQAPNFVYLVSAVGTSGAQQGTESKASGPAIYVSGLTLRKFLSNALVHDPDLVDVAIQRGSTVVKRGRLADVLAPSKPDFPLRPEDVVLLTETPYIRVYMTGSIARPGELKLRQGQTLQQAIALSGGLATPGPNSLTAGLPEKTKLVVRRGSLTMSIPASPAAESADFLLEGGDTIEVREPRFVHVTLYGEVRSPGSQALPEDATLAEALATAGGPLDRANLAGVEVFRRGTAARLNLVAHADLRESAVEDGDLIIVDRSDDFVYVLGEVGNPGRILLPNDGKPTTVLDALTLSGGLRADGVLRRVTLLHPDGKGAFVPRSLNVDEFVKDGKASQNPRLEPGDVVYVSKTNGLSAQGILQYVSSFLLIDSLARTVKP